MTAAIDTLSISRPSKADLIASLQPAIGERFGAPIAHLARAPSRYATSFFLENCDLTLEDGRLVSLVFKDLSPEALLGQARRTRPGFVYRPEREIEVYARLLAGANLGTAEAFPAAGARYWLFLERVDGVELYQVEDLRVWEQAARWLGGFHRRFGAEAAAALPGSVARYDAAWYRLWMRRATAFAPGEYRAAVRRLARGHDVVVKHLCDLPQTVIHGDFYASNVLTAGAGPAYRICPVDWERTAVGPGLLDLASLITGWDEESAGRIAAAYGGSCGFDHRSLAMCRLQNCIQWLGWAAGWTPPAEHRQDWLGDALRLADELGL